MAYTTSRPTETIERLTRTAYYLNLELYRRRIGQIAPCIAIQWKGVCSLCYQLDMLCPQVRLFKAISSTALRLLFDCSSTALRLLFDSASRRLRLLFDCCSTVVRLCFEKASTAVRLLFDCCSTLLRLASTASRRTPEGYPKNAEEGSWHSRSFLRFSANNFRIITIRKRFLVG